MNIKRKLKKRPTRRNGRSLGIVNVNGSVDVASLGMSDDDDDDDGFVVTARWDVYMCVELGVEITKLCLCVWPAFLIVYLFLALLVSLYRCLAEDSL